MTAERSKRSNLRVAPVSCTNKTPPMATKTTPECTNPHCSPGPGCSCWFHALASQTLGSRRPASTNPEPQVPVRSDHAVMRAFREHMKGMINDTSRIQGRVAQLLQHASESGLSNPSSRVAADEATKTPEAAAAWMEDLCALVCDTPDGSVRIPTALLHNMARTAGLDREAVVPQRRRQRQECRYEEDRAADAAAVALVERALTSVGSCRRTSRWAVKIQSMYVS